MKVKIKKLNESAVIPKYSKAGDAGMDLVATSKETDKYGNIVVKLTEEESDITDRKAIIRILEERGERKIWENN